MDDLLFSRSYFFDEIPVADIAVVRIIDPRFDDVGVGIDTQNRNYAYAVVSGIDEHDIRMVDGYLDHDEWADTSSPYISNLKSRRYVTEEPEGG